jgi:hypothetical protein
MKRILLLLIVSTLIAPLLVAAVDTADEGFSFSWFKSSSLYPEPIAQPLSTVSTLNILSVLDGQPRTIRYAGQDSKEYKDYSIYDTPGKYANETMYVQLKTGLNIGFLRCSYKGIIDGELSLHAGLNSVFQGFGGASNLGFDGVFFFGAQTRLFRMATVRIGLQHYSGHYGDETLEVLRPVKGDPIEYVRDNDLLFGLSVTPIPSIRLYAEANLPLSNTWMHPAIHIPWWVIKRTSGEPLHSVEAGRENIPTTDFDSSYMAWIISTGGEFSVPIASLGSVFLSADLTLHQDGQTGHTADGYDASNPWEMEYTIALGLELLDKTTGGGGRLQFTYHDGRFPLLNFFYQRTRYIAFGFSFSL